MKSLENLKEFQIKNELESVSGGVSGSYTLNGSLYTYDGNFQLTNTGSASTGVEGISGSSNDFSTDFCWKTTSDGVVWEGCAQRGGAGWVSI